MPNIINELKLDFKDVLLRPKRSTLRSRSDAISTSIERHAYYRTRSPRDDRVDPTRPTGTPPDMEPSVGNRTGITGNSPFVILTVRGALNCAWNSCGVETLTKRISSITLCDESLRHVLNSDHKRAGSRCSPYRLTQTNRLTPIYARVNRSRAFRGADRRGRRREIAAVSHCPTHPTETGRRPGAGARQAAARPGRSHCAQLMH
ncbi:GMP reductase 2 [Eumeta japonica]|uniref:GMP reductase 2 n=1 Tax=Eumeta variegata TaxID=151549 RepID=A0A4C1X0Y6_EUMVA|nr:GMP reductase 2 [Eumeta japonica]